MNPLFIAFILFTYCHASNGFVYRSKMQNEQLTVHVLHTASSRHWARSFSNTEPLKLNSFTAFPVTLYPYQLTQLFADGVLDALMGRGQNFAETFKVRLTPIFPTVPAATLSIPIEINYSTSWGTGESGSGVAGTISLEEQNTPFPDDSISVNGFNYTFTIANDHLNIFALHTETTRRWTGSFPTTTHFDGPPHPQGFNMTANEIVTMLNQGAAWFDFTDPNGDFYSITLRTMFPRAPKDITLSLGVSGSYQMKGPHGSSSGGGGNSVSFALEEQPIPLSLVHSTSIDHPSFTIQGKLVVIEGIANITNAGPVSTLPIGSRPFTKRSFPTLKPTTNTFCRVDIDTDGTISVSETGSVSFSGIVFRAK